ncbi:MAG: DUF5398 family protein [Chlamydiota bacterium]
MFGLEKEKKKPTKFQFDLEVEIAKNPTKAKEITSLCEQKVDQIKAKLKSGTHPDSFEPLGILIHGYNAMKRVVKKIEKKEATK